MILIFFSKSKETKTKKALIKQYIKKAFLKPEDKIAKEEGIKLAPADIDNKFKELGNAYGVSPDQIIKSISKNPEILSSLSQQAVNDKVRALLFENNKAEFKEAQPESK